MIDNIRNIAIIAHVDHGKTTLIDKLLKQSGVLKKSYNFIDRIMDSNELEKERGITILSKNASINWKNYRINIVDTPGHADFGGEVERIMSMVDSVLLLIDSVDGPMPQTLFVTRKAFNYGLKPIVVINKIDRVGSRCDWVLNQVFDMFIDLNATDDQLDFPVVYTSAINGVAGFDYKNMKENMSPLFESIIKYVSPPNVDIDGFFQMQITQLNYDKYLGVICIGRIKRGIIKTNQVVTIIDVSGTHRIVKVNQVLCYIGLQLIECKSAKAGDIIALTGLGKCNISDTICDSNFLEVLPPLVVDEPTISVLFSVNNSPFCGKEGKFLTSSQIFNRLNKERIHNVALRLEETKNLDTFLVSGRGELHLSILIENMRREGFEFSVSRPEVIFHNLNNIKHEPFELLILDIKKQYQGLIMEEIGIRKGIIQDMNLNLKDYVRIKYLIPSRGLIGFRNIFLTITSGTGIMFSCFSHYDKAYIDEIGQRRNGVLISNSEGKAVAYSLYNLQNRGNLFISHGSEVYEGQIIGINNRSDDLTVNCLISKKLTNMRAAGSDEAISLVSPIKMSLEQALGFINNDELVEITPKSIRLRKKYLTLNKRKINRY